MEKKNDSYTQDELEEILSRAFSYESREGHGYDHLETEYIGTVQRGKYFYDVYLDTGGHSWYLVRIQTEYGVVSEYEAVFGRPEPKSIFNRTRNGLSA